MKLCLPFVLLHLLASASADNQRHLNSFFANHPYVAPDIDEELGFSRSRSPCPALNTLANHGFINHNGINVTFRSVAEAAKTVFGFEKDVVDSASLRAIRNGIETKQVLSVEGDTELAFDLFDLYTNNVLETYGRLFRQDDFFEAFPQFNDTIFAELAAFANDGVLTTSDIVEHRVRRILQSRRMNPEATFDQLGGSIDYAQIIVTDLVAIANIGQDPDLETVPVESIRQFVQENRIPDGYLPRQERGLPLNSRKDQETEFVQGIFNRVKMAIESPLNDESEQPWYRTLYFIVPSVFCFSMFAVYLIYVSRSRCDHSQNFRGKLKRGTRPSDLILDIDPAISKRADDHVETKRGIGVKQMSRHDTDALEEDPTENSNHESIHVSSTSSGGLAPKDLSWHGVTVTVPSKNGAGESSRAILSNVSGCALSGQLTCILGHSGSGKTTLLGILGGRHRFSKSKGSAFSGTIKINGSVTQNQSLLMHQKHGIAFVGQDDFSMRGVTPREAIRFSARLRLSRYVSEEFVEAVTTDILQTLKLTHVEDRTILKTGTLSGGEKRRVSLGVELVTSPQIFLLDEITSGLDSHSAYVVMDTCRRIARDKSTTMVVVIHQPSSLVFSLMDRVVLMNSGKCMYNGAAGDVDRFFADRGFPVPPGTFSTPDWILHVSREQPEEVLVESGFYELIGASDDCAEGIQPINSSHVSKDPADSRVSFVTEFVELFHREYLILIRDPMPVLSALGMISVLSLLIGIVFTGVGRSFLDDQEHFASHVGVIFTTMLSCVIMAMKSITATVMNRSRFCREFFSGHYRLLSYGIVMMIFELFFILACGVMYSLTLYWSVGFNADFYWFIGIITLYGSVCSALGFAFTSLFDVASDAQPLVPLVLAPQLLLSGFLVTRESLAQWIRWLVWMQPLTYGFRTMLNKELSVCQEISHEQRLYMNCAESIWAGVQAVKGGRSDAMYDDDSVLTLMQGGQYKGARNILEYLSYFSEGQTPFSLFWDHCQLHDSEFITVNEVRHGFCDVTVASASETRLNRIFRSKEIHDDSMINFVLGRRLQLEYPEDLSSFTVKTESVFLPPDFIDFGYKNSRSQAMSSSVCGVLEATCPTEFKANGFVDVIDCVRKMESLPLTEANAVGLITVDSNSTGCRQLHASLAVLSPELHCPHLSFVPLQDVNGYTKCSKSADYSLDDYFTGQDMVLFQRTAQMNGINHETFFSESVPKGQCASTAIRPATIQSARGLPEHLYCLAYLESQQATDDYGLIGTYWAALVGFLVFYCAGGLWLLRRRALS